MSEQSLQSDSSRSPGQQIRAAREAAGLHIVALAAALKVPVRKLEALEADRWTELTDPTFTRALASSVARHLKLDASSVLAGLPTVNADSLHIPAGLGQAQTGDVSFDWKSKANPVMLASMGLLVLAVGVYFMPTAWVETAQVLPEQPVQSSLGKGGDVAGTPLGATESVPPQPSGSSSAPVTAAEVVVPAAREASAPSASANGSPASETATSAPRAGGGVKLTLVLKGQSWVEVVDASGKLRLQRIATAGESLQFEDASSYSVVLGNAAVVDVQINGQAKDMSEFARNNVARFQAR
jgi:cytoskeleton protein RodZ